MANIGKWATPGSLTTVLSGTELNSLANGATSAAGSAYDNGANLDLYVAIEIFLNTLSPAAGAYVSVYFAPTLDGTNYGDINANYFAQLLCTSPVDTTAASTKRIIVPNILLPAAKGKFYLLNGTGVALAASGNTVKVLPYNVNLNG